MKIIHIITSLNIGGAEQVLKQFLLSAPDAQRNTLVISLKNLGKIGEELQSRGFEVVALNMRSFLAFPVGFFRLYRLIRHYRPDIVQTWLYHADLIGGVVAKFAGVKNIVWGIHTVELREKAYFTEVIRKLLAWFSYSIPSKIICVAEASRKKHIALGYDASKMVVIGNGFDMSALQSTPTLRSEFRQAFGLGDQDVVIGTLGRLSQVKGQDVFIRSAGLIAEVYPNVRFLMIGRELEATNKIVMEWINATGFTDRFVLTGERPDVAVVLSAMDIFCLSSRSEAFPLVLGEAMAMGLPCVSTDVGDTGVLLGDTGLLVHKDDYEALTVGLKQMLDMSEDERTALGERAKLRVQNEFTLEQTHKKFEAVYAELLASRGLSCAE
jgi:glycosyltransferase involved in cell wall biosynthesis